MMWPFSLLSKKSVDQFSITYASLLYGLGAASWVERRFDLLAREGYERNPIVYACVTKLAKAVASVDLHLYQRSGGKLKRIDKHPVLDLLAHPNPTQGGRRFLEAAATNYLVGGNAYILGEGPGSDARTPAPPKELWLLPNAQVSVEPAKKTMFALHYDFTSAEGGKKRFEVDQLTGRCKVLHLKTVNVMNPVVGMPPMMAAAYGVDVFNAGQEWNKALLDHDARPAGALEVVDGEGKPASLTPDQRGRLRDELDASFAGKKNAGRPLVLEGGMKWTPMSLSPKDMDHRENMLTNARFIAGVYHTPPQLVNIPGESTFSNYGQAELSYWGDTVLTLLGSLLEDVNNWLLPLYGDKDTFLWYDEDEIPALEPRRKEKADRINASSFMRVNEKRRAMGLDDDPEGDVLLVDSRMVPIALAGRVTPDPADDEDDEDDENEGKKSAYTRLGKAVRRKPIPFDRAVTRKARRALRQAVATVLKEAAAQAIQKVRAELDNQVKAGPNDQINRDKAKRIVDGLTLDALDALVDATPEHLERVLADTGMLALAQVGVVDRANLVNQVNERALDYARDRAAEMVGKRWIGGVLVDNPDAEWRIDEAIRDELQDIIAQGLFDNIGADAIANEIEQAAGFSDARAKLIADTEIARANSEGSLEGYRAARDAGVTVKKEWLPDAEACPVCTGNADAGPIELDAQFPSGDDGPPAHPNCECALVPVTED